MQQLPEPAYGPESPAVSTHLSILQGIIGRMSANSTSCKIQCVVLVAGLTVLASQAQSSAYVLLALIPTCLFLCLDAYYLALEQSFRNSYDAFVEKLHERAIVSRDLYVVRRHGNAIRTDGLRRLGSTAIWPFYSALAATILLVWQFDRIIASPGY